MSEQQAQDLFEFLKQKLTGGYPMVALRTHNPYYEAKVITDMLEYLPKLGMRLGVGDTMNPLEKFAWFVLDDHAEGYSGHSLKELIQMFSNTQPKESVDESQ